MRFRLYTIRILVVLIAFTIACRAQSSSGEFTVVTLPDTQNYSQYYPQILTSQTQWIAANAKALNIQFVLGLGDIVNNGSDTTQYANADASYRVLDNAKIPYLAAIGNHDYKSATPMTRDATVFNSYFGPSRYEGKIAPKTIQRKPTKPNKTKENQISQLAQVGCFWMHFTDRTRTFSSFLSRTPILETLTIQACRHAPRSLSNG